MKTIVMTGGTAGIGLAALQRIGRSSDVRLLVGARGRAPAGNPIAPPEHADAEKLARGQVKLTKSQGSRSGIRAYSASKLCNLLTVRALASSAIAQDRRLRVIAYTPGLTPGTQLTRNQSLVFRLIHALVMRILSATRSMNTVAGGGDLLADLALGHIVPPTGRLYASHVKRHLTWPDISELASDDGVMTKLWRDSAAPIGFPGE